MSMNRLSICLSFLLTTSNLIAQSNDSTLLASLISKRIAIDSLYETGKTQIFGKTYDGLVVEFDDVDSIPEDVQTVFLLLIGIDGQIVSSIESPISESGDWYLELVHYFDAGGKTFAFQEFFSTFRNGCSDLPANETMFKYFQNSTLLSEQRSLMDDNGKMLNDSCVWKYDSEYKIYPEAKEFLNGNKLK